MQWHLNVDMKTVKVMHGLKSGANTKQTCIYCNQKKSKPIVTTGEQTREQTLIVNFDQENASMVWWFVFNFCSCKTNSGCTCSKSLEANPLDSHGQGSCMQTSCLESYCGKINSSPLYFHMDNDKQTTTKDSYC